MPHNYQWISKHAPEVRDVRQKLEQLLQDVHHDLQLYTFTHRVVGSYQRNMITYDTKSNVGFDLDVNIYPNDPDEGLYAKEIKLGFKASLDKFGWKYGFASAKDSTRVLTIKVKDRLYSRVSYSVDFAFVNDYKEKGVWRQQYIRYNKYAPNPHYSWAEQSKGFCRQAEKYDWLMRKGLKDELLDYYIDKKNHNTNPDCHSRSILAQAINEFCQIYGYNG